VVSLSAHEFQQRLANDKKAVVLDVRRPEEYRDGHLKNAILMNWLDAEAFKTEAQRLKKKYTYYVYCRSGRRSLEASKYLKSLGFKVVDLKGGYLDWVKNGLPVEK
ncbi:MAG: rhodanese-like domain-containing protein, partial [Bacteroidales bacterium]|nr:rhodanese-like domain-containing protein [Bacteroidales bacterium]